MVHCFPWLGLLMASALRCVALPNPEEQVAWSQMVNHRVEGIHCRPQSAWARSLSGKPFAMA